MSDDSLQQSPNLAGVITGDGDGGPEGNRVPRIAWSALSIGFLAWLLLADVPARFWRRESGETVLVIEWKSIRRIWSVQIDDLPQVSQQWLMNGVFIGAMIVFVAGVILAGWYISAPERDADA